MASIFMLHRVLPEYDPNSYYFQRETAISWKRFTQLLDKTEADGSDTLPASALHKASPQSVCITFDDGYADNLPALKEIVRRGMTATLFPVRDFTRQQFSPIDDMAAHLKMRDDLPHHLRSSIISGRIKKIARRLSFERYRCLRNRLFSLTKDALSDDLFLTENQLCEISAAGIELGIHGCSHRTFTSLSAQSLEGEILDSQRWLRSLGASGDIPICFPHGAHNTETVSICRQYSNALLGVDCQPVCHDVHRRVHIKEGA